MLTIYSWDVRRSSLRCESCGMTEQQLAKSARVGCVQCYDTFKRLLTPYIRQIHGQTEYVGNAPQHYTPPVEVQVQKLQREMQFAIAQEKFEEAARLRDAIREIESKEGDKDEPKE